MLARRWLESVLTVRGVQGHEGNSRAVTIGDLEEFGVNLGASWTPCCCDLLNQQGSTTSFGGHGLLKRGAQIDHGGLHTQGCNHEGHRNTEEGGWVQLHGSSSVMVPATSANALIPCFVVVLRKGLMRARTGA